MNVSLACNGSIGFQILPAYPINNECHGILSTENVSFQIIGAGSSGEFTDVSSPLGVANPKFRFTGVIASGNSQVCATTTVSVTLPNGDVCEKTGTICYEPEPGIYIGGDNCIQEPLFSEYETYLDNAPDNLPVFLLSSLRFDKSYTSHRVWNIIEGASITVEGGQSLQLEGANFSTSECNNLWQGIIAEKEASVSLTGQAEISDAAFAIASYEEHDASISVSNSTLSNNYEGIHVEYNETEVTVENSNFTSPELKNFSECLSGVTALDLCGKGYAGINIIEGSHFFMLTSNDFRDIGNGVLLYNTRASIHQQFFTNIFEECFMEMGGFGIKTLNETDFPAWGHFVFNTFNNTDYAIQGQDPSGTGDFHIRRNQMSSIYRGVELDLMSQAVNDNFTHIFDNNILSMSQGHFLPLRDKPIGISVVTNDEEPSTFWTYRNNINVQMRDAIGIYYVHTGTTSRFTNSEIWGNLLTLDDDPDQTGIRIDGEIGSVVFKNTINGIGNPMNRIGINTRGGEGNTLCENIVNFERDGVGIEVSGTQSQSISYNTLSGGEYGAKLDRNCIPQGIDANIILGSPTVGLYNQSNAGLNVTDNQVDKRNSFPPGVTEVTIDGLEQYLTQTVSGPTSLGDSPPNNWSITGDEGVRSCANVVGDIIASGFDGDSSTSPSNDSGPAYANMRQRTAEGKLSGDLGRDYDYEQGLFSELSKYSNIDPRFSTFYNSQNLRAAGILHQAKMALERPTITPTEREFLENARINNDKTGVRAILIRASVLKKENVSSAMELINSIQNGKVPELALRDARAAFLNGRPTSTELSYWKTIAEGCYEEYGPAVYEFQRAYYAATSQVLQSRCLESRNSMPLNMQEQSAVPNALYTLAPNVTSSQVKIVGLEESVDIRVVDLYGRTVKQIQKLQPGQQINLKNLPAAQYLIVFDEIDHAPLRVVVQ